METPICDIYPAPSCLSEIGNLEEPKVRRTVAPWEFPTPPPIPGKDLTGMFTTRYESFVRYLLDRRSSTRISATIAGITSIDGQN